MISNARLEELKRLRELATPGERVAQMGNICIRGKEFAETIAYHSNYFVGQGQDAEYLSAAANSIDGLLERLQKAEEALKIYAKGEYGDDVSLVWIAGVQREIFGMAARAYFAEIEEGDG